MPPTVPVEGLQLLFVQEAALQALSPEACTGLARGPGGQGLHSPDVACSHSAQGAAHNGSPGPLFTDPFPFVSVSASLSLRVSGSLQFPNILPGPLGSGAEGAGQWEQDSVLFSPRTIRAGKGWSQGWRGLPPPPFCLPWHPTPALTLHGALRARQRPPPPRPGSVTGLSQISAPAGRRAGRKDPFWWRHLRAVPACREASRPPRAHPPHTQAALFTPVSGSGGSCWRVSAGVGATCAGSRRKHLASFCPAIRTTLNSPRSSWLLDWEWGYRSAPLP